MTMAKDIKGYVPCYLNGLWFPLKDYVQIDNPTVRTFTNRTNDRIVTYGKADDTFVVTTGSSNNPYLTELFTWEPDFQRHLRAIIYNFTHNGWMETTVETDHE